MDFLDLSILDIIDILLAAWLLYQVYKLVRGTVAINIFMGVTAIYLIWKLTEALQMHLLSEILGQFIGVGFIALIIVFQQEIRRFLLMIGSANFSKKITWLRPFQWMKNEESVIEIDPVVTAALHLSETLTGALIIIGMKDPLGQYAQTGDFINADISSRLLESIFVKDSPMHDGAVLIEKKKITATRAILPVSENERIPAKYGLRHRAAMGLTERIDAIALVVSEETGGITIIEDGQITPVKHEDLRAQLVERIAL